MSYRKLPLVVSLLAGVALCALGTDASAVNVPPTIAGLANKNQAWNAPAPPIASVGTVVDTDSPDFNTGRLTVKMVAIAPSTVLVTDKLSIRNQGVAAGLIGFTGVAPFTVTYSGVAIGTANAAFVTSTTNFVITFNSGAATPTAVQALLRNITYQSTAASTAIGKTTTVQFQVTDGDGGTSNLASEVITLIQVSPLFSGLTDTTSAFFNTRFLIDTNATVADPDSADFNGGYLRAVMTTTGTHTVTAFDKLSIRNQGTAVGLIGFTGVTPFTVTYGNVPIGTANAAFVTGLAPLRVNFTTGAATSTAVQALLRNVTYQDTETTFTVGNRTVQFTGADGDGGTSAAVNKPIHLGKADGVHNGTYIGMFSAPAFKIVNQPIPGPTIPAGSNTIVTTVTGTAASVSLPGIGGTGTGTVIPSTDFSGTAKFNGNSVGSIFGVTLTIGFGGTMTLNAADGVSSSGTWLIVNTPGVTGSGTWSGTRP